MELFSTQTILLLYLSSLFLSLSYTNAVCVPSMITNHSLLDKPISPTAAPLSNHKASPASPTPPTKTQQLKIKPTSTPPKPAESSPVVKESPKGEETSTGTPAVSEPSPKKPDQNAPVFMESRDGEGTSTTLSTSSTPSPKKADQFAAVLMESPDGGNPADEPPEAPSESQVMEMESPDGSMPSDPTPAEKPDSAVVDKLLQPLLTTADADPSVKKICESTDNPILCAGSLMKALNGNIDAKNALKTEIQVAIKAFEEVLVEVNKLMQSSSTDSTASKCLDTCKESYDSALDSLKSSLEAIEAGDIGTRDSMLSSVVTMVGTCDDTFHGLNVASPLENLSSTLMKLGSNCLAISKLVS